jgi:hypothetical protein
MLGSSISAATCGPAVATDFCGPLPDGIPDGGPPAPCCVADGANRYVEAAVALGQGNYSFESICSQNYSGSLAAVVKALAPVH